MASTLTATDGAGGRGTHYITLHHYEEHSVYSPTTEILVVAEACPSAKRDSEALGVRVAEQVYVSESEMRRVLNSTVVIKNRLPGATGSADWTVIRPLPCTAPLVSPVHELVIVKSLMIPCSDDGSEISQVSVRTLPA